MKLATAFALLTSLATSATATVRHVPSEYSTIQDGIDHCVDGDVVLIAPGTYRGQGNRNLELRGLDITVTSSGGAEATAIDCEYAGRGFFLHEGETRDARIEGLTIRRGHALTGYFSGTGGGILIAGSSPTLSNLRILECEASLDGGGISLAGFDGVMEDCVISGNYANSSGGGLEFAFGEADIRRCIFSGNGAPLAAGVSFTSIGPNRLVECTITANFAGYQAGGIWSPNALVLDRCILWGNCTIFGYSELLISSQGAVMNCCLVDTDGISNPEYVQYNDCVFTDPLFCGPQPCSWLPGGDWTVDAASPCLAENSPCGELIGALGQGCGFPTPTGACCVSNSVCVVTTEQDCSGQSGSYQGDHTTCDPNPCVPVAIESSSWGGIKARYGR